MIVTFMSPPSRAAWIEIRNAIKVNNRVKSPPSRAAWIEIPPPAFVLRSLRVAAFTGGVD